LKLYIYKNYIANKNVVNVPIIIFIQNSYYDAVLSRKNCKYNRNVFCVNKLGLYRFQKSNDWNIEEYKYKSIK